MKFQAAGTYKTKEQIQKAPTDDHPCNLTRTSVNKQIEIRKPKKSTQKTKLKKTKTKQNATAFE